MHAVYLHFAIDFQNAVLRSFLSGLISRTMTASSCLHCVDWNRGGDA